MRRRRFLRGAAVVAAPLLLGGCGASLPAARTVARPEDLFLGEFAIDDAALGRILATLGGGPADFGEVYFQHRIAATARLENGQLRPVVRDELLGAGLRTARAGRVWFASSDDLDEVSLLGAARQAAGPPGGNGRTASGRRRFLPPGDRYRTGAAWRQVDDGRRLQILERVDGRVRNADPTVSSVEIVLGDADEWILIATLDGRLVADRRPMTRLSVRVTMTRDGEPQSGFASIAGRQSIDWYTDERLGELAATALANTGILFDARRPPAAELPVVLAAGASGVLIHEALGHAFEADFVADGRSPYGSSIGVNVAGAALTLVDDATLAGQRGALNVDDEGERGRRNVIVEDGRLRSFLHDRLSAQQTGVSPTGNGRRESYRHAPMPRMTTTLIENGTDTPEALIGAVDRGILAESYTGASVDLGGGDFRFRVRHGWYIENGEKRVPVRDFELVGNGPELLRNVSKVANDARLDPAGWTCGKNEQVVPVSHGMPSVLVERLGVVPLS